MNENRYKKAISELKDKNQFRILRNMSQREGTRLMYEGKPYLNLSSNDYLGLAFDEVLLHEFYINVDNGSIDKYGLGASSSRLLTGNTVQYSALETLLASIYEREAALLFNSGYHANIGILPAITTKNDLILSDKLNHASIIDGIRLSQAECIRYKHFDYEQLEDLLHRKRNEYENAFIVTESVFSMDGDIADLKQLVDLKKMYNAALYVDEAHAFGTRGKSGLGICDEQNLVKEIDFIVGTFGKALASQGAFVICSELMKQYLINTVRSLIFTTGLPPVTISWLLFLIDKIKDITDKRDSLAGISEYVRTRVQQLGHCMISESNIIPIVLGENKRAEEAATLLQAEGYLVFPVRPPTVPPGTARLRLSLSADMNENDFDRFFEVVEKIGVRSR